MRKILYSSLAIVCAVTGTTAGILHPNLYRAQFCYKYIGPLPVSTCHQVTLTTNWTLVTCGTPTCASNIQACSVTTTIPFTTLPSGRKVPKKKIGCAQTVTGFSPRFTAVTGNGVTTVFSQPNSQ